MWHDNGFNQFYQEYWTETHYKNYYLNKKIEEKEEKGEREEMKKNRTGKGREGEREVQFIPEIATGKQEKCRYYAKQITIQNMNDKFTNSKN